MVLGIGWEVKSLGIALAVVLVQNGLFIGWAQSHLCPTPRHYVSHFFRQQIEARLIPNDL